MHSIEDLEELILNIPTTDNCRYGKKSIVLKDGQGNSMYPQPSNKIFGQIDILDLYNKMSLRIMELEERIERLEEHTW